MRTTGLHLGLSMALVVSAAGSLFSLPHAVAQETAPQQSEEAQAPEEQVPALEGELVYFRTPHDALFDLTFQGTRGWAVGNFGLIVTTDDSGRTWQEQQSGTRVGLLSVDFVDEQRGIAVGQAGTVLTTTDGGGTWTEAEAPAEERLFSVDINQRGLGVATGEFGALLLTRDFGQTWTRLEPDFEAILDRPEQPHLYDVSVAENGEIWVAGEFGMVMISRDGGQTWTGSSVGEESLFGLIRLNDAQAWAVGQDGIIIRSDDGGANWQRIDWGGHNILLDIWVSPHGEGVIPGIRTVLRSRDGGQTWYPLSGPLVSGRWYQAVAKAQEQLAMEANRDEAGVQITPAMTLLQDQVFITGLGAAIIRLEE